VKTADIGGNWLLDRRTASHDTVGYPSGVICGRSWACTDPLYLCCQMRFRDLFVSVLKLGLHPATAFADRYTGCPGRNVPDFGRMFLKLKYTDLTKNTCIRSWTVTEIMARGKCGLLAVPLTVPGSRDVLPVHCACPSFSLKPAQAHSRCDCTFKVLGTLRTTATLVRGFM